VGEGANQLPKSDWDGENKAHEGEHVEEDKVRLDMVPLAPRSPMPVTPMSVIGGRPPIQAKKLARMKMEFTCLGCCAAHFGCQPATSHLGQLQYRPASCNPWKPLNQPYLEIHGTSSEAVGNQP